MSFVQPTTLPIIPSIPLEELARGFRQRFPWFGGHLQTIGKKAVADSDIARGMDCREFIVPLDDGTNDELRVELWQSDTTDSIRYKRPILVLLHGLGGHSRSHYIRAAAAQLRALDHDVMLVDFRAAGGSAPFCTRLHHPGRSEDVGRLLRGLESEHADAIAGRDLFLVGYSLGGSVALNYLANLPNDPEHDSLSRRICGVATISTPLDLAATSRGLNEPRRKLYQWYLLRKVREQALADEIDLSGEERAAIRNARTIWELDETFSSGRCGMDSAEAYYEAFSAHQSLPHCRVPTLMIFADDDPFVASSQYDEVDWRPLDSVQLLRLPRGGHIGFIARGAYPSYSDYCVHRFVEALSAHRLKSAET